MSFRIIGTGRALPKLAVSNNCLSSFLDTTHEWIQSRTGIENRYCLSDETLLTLATKAAKSALENAKVAPSELDYIICTTIGAEYLTPSLACLVQRDIGASCPAVDLNAACTGFIYALDLAAAYFKAKKARHILIVSAEMMSHYVNWQDRGTCVLFGDGAGAVLLQKGKGLLSIKLTAKGDDTLLAIGRPAGNSPFYKLQGTNRFLEMAGKDVFKFAVSSMCRDLRDVLAMAGLTVDNISKVIPHQANLRIITAAKEKLGLAQEQLLCGIAQYGNTSSASIPILLSEYMEKGDLRRKDIIALAAFGGGLTSGACIIQL